MRWHACHIQWIQKLNWLPSPRGTTVVSLKFNPLASIFFFQNRSFCQPLKLFKLYVYIGKYIYRVYCELMIIRKYVSNFMRPVFSCTATFPLPYLTVVLIKFWQIDLKAYERTCSHCQLYFFNITMIFSKRWFHQWTLNVE